LMLSSAYPLEGRVCENASPALKVSADDPAHPNHLSSCNMIYGQIKVILTH
jgi:hypothetical protein